MTYRKVHRGASFAGLDWYYCDECTYKTPDENAIQIHIDMFHPQESYTVKELREIAKANDMPIRGTKAELLERLEGIL